MKVPEIKHYQRSNLVHARQEAVQQVLDLMGEEKGYPYWNGRTKHLSPSEIIAKVGSAKNGKNPQALFNWLLAQSQVK